MISELPTRTQTDGATELSDVESNSFAEIASQRLGIATSIVIERFTASDHFDLVAVTGPMAAWKTTINRDVAGRLAGLGMSVGVFKQIGDLRSGQQHESFCRTPGGNLTGMPVSHFGEIEAWAISNPGAAIIIDEAQFIPGVAENVLNLAKLGNKVLATGLATWYTGQKVQAMDQIMEQANLGFIAQGYDSLAPSLAADFTFRGDAINANGELKVPHDEASIYYNMAKGKRLEIRDRLLAELPNAHVLFQTSAEGDVDEEEVFLLPSGFSSKLYVSGKNRYRSMSANNFQKVYATVGHGLGDDVLPVTEAYRRDNLYNWDTAV